MRKIITNLLKFAPKFEQFRNLIPKHKYYEYFDKFGPNFDIGLFATFIGKDGDQIFTINEFDEINENDERDKKTSPNHGAKKIKKRKKEEFTKEEKGLIYLLKFVSDDVKNRMIFELLNNKVIIYVNRYRWWQHGGGGINYDDPSYYEEQGSNIYIHLNPDEPNLESLLIKLYNWSFHSKEEREKVLRKIAKEEEEGGVPELEEIGEETPWPLRKFLMLPWKNFYISLPWYPNDLGKIKRSIWNLEFLKTKFKSGEDYSGFINLYSLTLNECHFDLFSWNNFFKNVHKKIRNLTIDGLRYENWDEYIVTGPFRDVFTKIPKYFGILPGDLVNLEINYKEFSSATIIDFGEKVEYTNLKTLKLTGNSKVRIVDCTFPNLKYLKIEHGVKIQTFPLYLKELTFSGSSVLDERFDGRAIKKMFKNIKNGRFSLKLHIDLFKDIEFDSLTIKVPFTYDDYVLGFNVKNFVVRDPMKSIKRIKNLQKLTIMDGFDIEIFGHDKLEELVIIGVKNWIIKEELPELKILYLRKSSPRFYKELKLETIYGPEPPPFHYKSYTKTFKGEKKKVLRKEWRDTIPDYDFFSKLPKLEELVINNCKLLEKISNLKELKKLKIYRCNFLVTISDLPRLEELEINDCDLLVTISDLPRLEELEINNCKLLEKIIVPYNTKIKTRIEFIEERDENYKILIRKKKFWN